MINAIYTKLHNALGIYCTRNYEPIPKELPCMYFRESHFRPRQNITLGFTDGQLDYTFYIELYAKSGIQDLVSIVEETMNEMYCVEESCLEVDNADISIKRYVLTFSRIICEGDNNEMH